MLEFSSRTRLRGGALGAGVVLTAALVVSCSRPERPAGTFTIVPSAETAPVAVAEPNPVRDEMLLLAVAIGEVVAGIVDGDLSGVEAELHTVHQARAATELAIAAGHYRPPAASPEATLELFVALDQAFHHDLEVLLAASRAQDVGAAIESLGVVLEGCHGCHQVFRPGVTRESRPLAASAATAIPSQLLARSARAEDAPCSGSSRSMSASSQEPRERPCAVANPIDSYPTPRPADATRRG